MDAFANNDRAKIRMREGICDPSQFTAQHQSLAECGGKLM
jgi:hypothetical protein